MPPFLPRKRLRSPSPTEAGPSKHDAVPKVKSKGEGKSSTSSTPRKPTLFDSLDAGTRTPRTRDNGKALLAKLAAESDDESSLSSLSSDQDFEDVPATKRRKITPESDNEDEEEEDIEFEDVETGPGPTAPAPSGDLELTLNKDTRIPLTRLPGTKKGPNKVERAIRVSTHQVHVMMLMWHNALRNAWLCDETLQNILVGHLGQGVIKEVERWRAKCGVAVKAAEAIATPKKGKGARKGKKNSKGKTSDARSRRDWAEPADRLAEGEIDMSHGDPLFRLLKILVNFWKQRFRITAPGLRKMGYMSLQRLDDEIKRFGKESDNIERHGERVEDLKEFRECARKLEGSRDVGAQLFTALLRGLGLEARMVASLQPVGFGWNKNEDAAQRKEKKSRTAADKFDDSGDEEDEEDAVVELPTPRASKTSAKAAAKGKKAAKKTTKRASRGNAKSSPITLSDSEAEIEEEDDDDSVIDITPAKPRKLPSKPYDKDLLFPHYWTEVLSPVTNTFTPVDAVVLNVIATNVDLLGKFETRGQKAEKTKQVTAYIIGHSADGTAKDVTIRYLKNHMLPGRTKGNRLPAEKMPIYNANGKVKRYEQYDWFKTVMSGYVRGTKKCPRDEIDDHEEATDLKAAQPLKKEVKEGEETLQYFKSSPDFVLERHLKREEALKPNAKHVKMFTVKGKGDTSSSEEKVFSRKDVVHCKSMETWHKEGREPKVGEIPRKRVPFRAATTNRKRELAEAEHASGEKMLQGLYSRDQTEWIIPPPIVNGVIPKNSFGNMDVYVPSMVPAGACHLPYRGTVRICKKLGIDYAEAVTGFEFGARMAIPVITGVVVAEENEEMVMEQWEKDEEEMVRKEDEKRRKKALGMWRGWLMKLRVVKRFRYEYGDEGHEDVLNERGEDDKEIEGQAQVMEKNDEDMAGGFLPEGHHEEDAQEHHPSAFFPIAQEDDDEDDGGGGFIIENDEGKETAKPSIRQAYATPQSLDSNKVFDCPDSEPEADEDEDMEDVEEAAAPTPASKKRGRPPGASNKAQKKTLKATPAKRTPGRPKKTLGSKRKPQVEVSGEEDEAALSSPELSNADSDDASAFEVEDAKPARKKRKTISTGGAGQGKRTRKTPRRNAKTVGKGETKSKYFEHSEDDEE